MKDPFSMEGQVALVTGGGSGLGFGIAQRFVEAGAKVVIVGRRAEVLEEARQRLGERCFARPFDVTKKDALAGLVADVEANVGPLTALVNCAGAHLKKIATEVTDEEFLKILDVHVLSVFALSREALKVMLPRKRGSIILISSMTAIMGMEKVVAYSTAKAAVNGMMRALIADASANGIRVNAIAPGWIDTPMLHKAIDNDEPRRNKILARIPTRTFGRVEDIGCAAQYLASDAGAYVNGVFLPVDAGAAGAF